MPIHVKPTTYLTDDGGWVHTPDECRAPMHCRPVVVIDPGDSGAVERLHDLVFRQGADVNRNGLAYSDTQAALREYAKPTPPRPAEPTDPAARVIDRDRDVWATDLDGDWRCLTNPGKGGRVWVRLVDDFGPLEVRG